MKKKNKKITALITASFIAMIGIYNSVVINAESDLSSLDMKFVKRLDEVYGVVKAGRQVATTVEWKKIQKPVLNQIQKQEIATQSSSNTSAPEETIAAAAVQEELSLNLVEVINPQKYPQGTSSFSGNLATNNGVIESLSVSLPNGEGLSVSFSEMTGNVFEYDMNGELYSGMMYQVDQNSYMISLTNGPLEGTRLRFSTITPVEEQTQVQEQLSENNVQTQEFGSEQNPEMIVEADKQIQQEGMQAQAVNLEAQAM
ncbi:MAG: hypothetical protein AB7I27_16720 [Bacteriovoracaceae bacterium]